MDNDSYNISHYYNILRKNSLFTEINNESLLELLTISTPRRWPQKTCILEFQSSSHKFYIITSGMIKAYDYDSLNNRELVLFLLATNDVLNVCSLIGQDNLHLFYETLTPTEVLYIPMEKMQAWMARNPVFIRQILGYVLKKMDYLEIVVSDICLKNTSTRLAKLLLYYINTTTNQIETINGLTHDQLAGLIGTTRAVLNRHLQEFKDEGILDIKRKNIKIIDASLLYKKISSTIQ